MAAADDPWPLWSYFPRNARPPAWVTDFVAAVSGARDFVDTTAVRDGLRSDAVLDAVASPLRALGYRVEAGKASGDRIRRPVLYGDNGAPALTYEVDAVHEDLGVVVEVEAGRGSQSSAAYRDLIRASLILDASYLALMMPIAYRYRSGGKSLSTAAYRDTRGLLDAVYASKRLPLPLDGVLLVGY